MTGPHPYTLETNTPRPRKAPHMQQEKYYQNLPQKPIWLPPSRLGLNTRHQKPRAPPKVRASKGLGCRALGALIFYDPWQVALRTTMVETGKDGPTSIVVSSWLLASLFQLPSMPLVMVAPAWAWACRVCVCVMGGGGGRASGTHTRLVHVWHLAPTNTTIMATQHIMSHIKPF